MFSRRIRVLAFGLKKYKGNPEEICRQIVEDCWNGKYFQASTGHFNGFWTRDFGWCVKSLVKLDYRKECVKTLDYALSRFQKYGRITTTINHSGVPFDFPDVLAPDSLAYLLYALAAVNDKGLVEKYKSFLEQQVDFYLKYILDEKNGMIRRNIHLSSIKDHSIRNSSCYDNCMLAVISKSLDKLGLKNPLNIYDYKRIIVKNFWNGKFFEDDVSKKGYVAADANIIPFYFNIVTDKRIRRLCFDAIKKEGLDEPFPLKYAATKRRVSRMIIEEVFAQGYERNTIWMHIGLIYISELMKSDKKEARQMLERYTKLIERYRTFVEVFSPSGKPFKSMYYHADEGMLWAGNYLAL